MPEISNIPQNPWLGVPAEGLAKLKELAQTMAGSSSPLGVLAGEIGKLLIGNKPEMLADASYGFPPTKGRGEATYIKPEYSGDVADLLPQQALGKAVGSVASKAALAGIFVPAKKAAEEAYLRSLAQNPGIAKEQLWQSTGVAEFPKPGGGKILAEEIPGWSGQIAPTGSSTQGIVSDVLHHPELFAAVPSLAEAGVDIARVPATNWRGSYSPSMKEISGIYSGDTKLKELLEHEGQHHVQAEQGWPGGANFQAWVDTVKNTPQQVRDIVGTMAQKHREAGNNRYASLLEDQYLQSLQGSKQSATWLGAQIYQHDAGEIMARMAQDRAHLPPDVAAKTFPRPTVFYKDDKGLEHTIEVPLGAHRFETGGGFAK